MDHQDFALAVIAVSILSGFVVSGVVELPGDRVRQAFTFDSSNDSQVKPSETGESANQSFEFGSAHEHALFHVVVNGSELDFTDRRFQLNSDYVHLENYESEIVHKHAEGVTWSYFFETINLSVRNESEDLCVDIYNESYCGNGTVVLNGDKNPDLDTEIFQGDNLAIIIGKDNESLAEEYMKRQLPQRYKPSESRGRRL